MRRLSVFGILVVALGLAIASTAAATKTVHIKSSVSLYATLNSGRVSADNPACADGRRVVVKYRDAKNEVHRFGGGISKPNGTYSITAGSTTGPLPYKFYAVASRSAEGTAGTIYVCDAAKSKIRLISGG